MADIYIISFRLSYIDQESDSMLMSPSQLRISHDSMIIFNILQRVTNTASQETWETDFLNAGLHLNTTGFAIIRGKSFSWF